MAPDRTPPLLVGTNVPAKKSYTVAEAPQTFEGTVSDASGVDYLLAFLYRYRINSDGTVTAESYDPETKAWIPQQDFLPYAAIYGKDQDNPKSFNWKFTFPEYEPGYVYGMAVDAIDIYGNYTSLYEANELYIEFAVTENPPANASPS